MAAPPFGNQTNSIVIQYQNDNNISTGTRYPLNY